MAVQMPTEVSLKWWDKNAPASLPKNKAIEKALKTIQSQPVRESVQALNDAGNLVDLKAVFKECTTPYSTLIDELKRYRAVVTKSKESHKDFTDAIDILIRLAKAELNELADTLKIRMTGETAARTSNSQALSGLQRNSQRLAALRRKIGDLHRQTLGAADKETLEDAIGQNRKVQQVVKEVEKVSEKDFGKVAEPDDDVTAAAEAVRATCAELMKLSRALDKAMVLKAVEVLGNDKGKKLFLETKAATALG